MYKTRDGTHSTGRRAWGYSQAHRYGRDTRTLKGLGCTNLDHNQGLVPTFSRDNLEVDSSEINNDCRRVLHA